MIKNNTYDIIIVGAGPTGLSVAQCCSSLKDKRILVIDRENTIGGCHRVIRKDGIFTEHGPRVYTSHYKNLFALMREFNVTQDDMFVDYKYSTMGLVCRIILKMELREVLKLIEIYIYYIFNKDYGIDVNLEEYMRKNGFTENTIDVYDRIFRIMDGASISKYSVNKVLNIIDTSLLATIIQPKRALDEGLFSIWKEFLERRGVEFLMDTEVEKIGYNIDSMKIKSVNGIRTDQLILAVPPVSLSKILRKAGESDKKIKDAFGDYGEFHKWSENTEYIEYISITYHFKEDVKIPIVNGATLDTDWGLVCINLTDYMIPDNNNIYKKVLSVAVTYTDRKSRYIYKTANECSDRNEICDEVYRQLKESIYQDLPDHSVNKAGYIAIMNPNNYYKNGKWNCRDEAYFETVGTKYLKNSSETFKNLFNAGTHNGNSYIKYTLMESAVSNGISLSLMLYPELNERYALRTFLGMRDYIIIFVVIMIIILCIYIICLEYDRK